jgi:hypothetical protein
LLYRRGNGLRGLSGNRRGWERGSKEEEDEYLRANKSTNSTLGASDRLVPASLRTVGVILRDCARGRGRVTSELGGGMGCVVLELCFVFLGFACVLFACQYIQV